MITAKLIEYMGSDHTVANAARVSFDKAEYPEEINGEYRETESNKNLIRYLARHGHYSPFGHCYSSFVCRAPIFVARQLVKHKFLRWNEVSRRYVKTEPVLYKPVLRKAVADKKQGSGDLVNNSLCDAVINLQGIQAVKQYDYLLKMGVCEEQARVVLPQNLMTEWWWSGSMDAFAAMCNLRDKDDAQEESRQVAWRISKQLEEVWPVSWKALRSNDGAH